MLEGVGGKDADYAIRTCTVESTTLSMAAESAWNLDIHPLLELSLFVENVDVAIVCDYKYFGQFYGDTHKYLHLDLRQISRL